MDINQTIEPVPINLVKDPVFALDVLQSVSARYRQDIDGVVVLTRSSESGRAAPSITERQLDWLSSLSDLQLAHLAKGTFAFEDLDGSDRAKLLGVVPLTATQLGQILSSPPSQVRLALNLWVEGEYTDPRSGKKHTSFAWTAEAPGLSQIGQPKGETPAAQSKALPAPRGDGSLKLGKGQVLKLSEIVGMATRAFGQVYVFDRRLKDSPVFISGSFTQERFEKCLATILRPIAFQTLPQSASILSRLNEILKANPMSKLAEFQGLSGGALELSQLSLTRPTVSSSLLEGNPGFGAAFEKLGLRSGDVQVALKPILALGIQFGPPEKREGAIFLLGY